jgi:hypothetical protein
MDRSPEGDYSMPIFGPGKVKAERLEGDTRTGDCKGLN